MATRHAYPAYRSSTDVDDKRSAIERGIRLTQESCCAQSLKPCRCCYGISVVCVRKANASHWFPPWAICTTVI
ncbi:hypothetical protein KCP77_21595 [Salmonella enterica subsp. enterica]|nr:hypothetical protein KCP77_21595 [Salmonella enterica subsp. enterica]